MTVLEHNYNRKLLQLARAGKVPTDSGVWHLEVKHDDGCALLSGGGAFCDCDPDLRFVDDKTWLEENPPDGIAPLQKKGS